MSQATAIRSPIVEGRLQEQQGDRIILNIPDTDYRLHLVSTPLLSESASEGAGMPTLRGTIHANARRVDSVPSGGRYIEPGWGRPRRIQGRIIAGDVAANTLTVDCVVPVIVTLMASQSAGDFFLGQMVSFDVEAGATFEPA